MKNKKVLPTFDNIEITNTSSDGRAVTRIDNIVTFVNGAVPGDVVKLQITKKRSAFMEASVSQIRKPSPNRVKAACKHFGICGGCKWQNLNYEEQIKYKQQQVEQTMHRIGKIENLNIQPIIGAKSIFHYRNKLEFAFAAKQWLTTEQMQLNIPFAPGLGFHYSGHFNKVINIEQCLLMTPEQDNIRNEIREYALNNNLSFYNETTHQGLLRNIIVRNNAKDEWMVVIVFGEQDNKQQNNMLTKNAQNLLQFIQNSFPKIISLQYCINTKMNDSINDLPVFVWNGTDHIIETLEHYHFKVGPKSFYQTNNEQVLQLYKVILNFVSEKKNEPSLPIIYDLYTGTGTIALFVSQYAKKVIGIEYVEDAIQDATINAADNQVNNTFFIAGDVKTVLTQEFINCNGKPDIIITDPPRVGMHPDVITTIIKTKCPTIIYVSCNPATQARDINLLSPFYNIQTMQPVDMFPHTHHVENVTLLNRKN